MFRSAKPFGQALRPEPAGVPPAAYGGSTAGGCTPRPQGGLRPPRHGLDGQRRHPSHTADQWEGGMGASPHVSAQRYPCPMLRRSVSRSRSTPRSHDAWHGGTTPHAPPARPVKPVFSGLLAASSASGRDTMPQASPGGPRAACRRGDMQGQRPRRPTAGWAEVGGLFAPLGGASHHVPHLRVGKM